MNQAPNAINWHPWRDNPLDWIKRPLRTVDGRAVLITQPAIDFVLFVDGVEHYRTSNNSALCYELNRLEVGL